MGMTRWLLLAALVVDPAQAQAPAAQAKPAQPATPAATVVSPTGQATPGLPVRMQGRDAVDPSVPEKWRDEIREAQLQGALLQQEDFAVWVASNALVRSGLKAPATTTGWIARPQEAEARTWKVTFTGRDGTREFAYADVIVDLTTPPPQVQFQGHAAAGRPLDADELALAKARGDIAKRKGWMRCADDYNYSVGFRDAAKGREVFVRTLPARYDGKNFVFGGFSEFRYPAGARKPKHFEQTQTCMDLTLPSEGVGFMVTHRAGKTPSLFHVFLNLSYGKPVYVKTISNGKMWKIQDGRVSVVDKDSITTRPAPGAP